MEPTQHQFAIMSYWLDFLEPEPVTGNVRKYVKPWLAVTGPMERQLIYESNGLCLHLLLTLTNDDVTETPCEFHMDAAGGKLIALLTGRWNARFRTRLMRHMDKHFLSVSC